MTKEEKKEYNKKYRELHKEEMKEYNKKYRELHKEEMKEYHKNYYEVHKEETKEYHKNYYETHKEEIKEYCKNYHESHKKEKKKYYEAHKEEMKEYHKNYYEAHKEEIKEHYKNYYESHKEKQNKKVATIYYSKKNEFHGLNIQFCIYSYYKGRGCGGLCKYFSSLENYVSFSLNSDANLKKSLIRRMYLGDISEQDALDAAAIPLTEEDLEYIHENDLKYRPKEID